MPPGWAAAQTGQDAAFSIAGPVFGCAYAIWRDPAADDANIGWLRDTSAAVAPAVTGHYVGETDLGLPARAAGSFAPAARRRLMALRDRYDPSALFHGSRPGPDGTMAGTGGPALETIV